MQAYTKIGANIIEKTFSVPAQMDNKLSLVLISVYRSSQTRDCWQQKLNHKVFLVDEQNFN